MCRNSAKSGKNRDSLFRYFKAVTNIANIYKEKSEFKDILILLDIELKKILKLDRESRIAFNEYIADIYWYVSDAYVQLGDYKNAVLYKNKEIIQLKEYGSDEENIDAGNAMLGLGLMF